MLSGKQKRYLRALANNTLKTVIIGKDGISDNVIKALINDLKAHELVKVSLLKTCELSAREIAIELSINSKSEIVQIIGRTIVFYKKSDKKLINLA